MYKHLCKVCLVSLLFSSSSSYAMEADSDDAGDPSAGKGGTPNTLDESQLNANAQRKRYAALGDTGANLVVLKRTIRAFQERLNGGPDSTVDQRLKRGSADLGQAFNYEDPNGGDFVISGPLSTNIEELEPLVFESTLSEQFQSIAAELEGLKDYIEPEDKQTYLQLQDSFLAMTRGYQSTLVESFILDKRGRE